MTPIPGYKASAEYNENKIHLDQNNYACLMSYEMFKMFKQHVWERGCIWNVCGSS